MNSQSTQEISGHIVDIINNEIYDGRITIKNKIIHSIEKTREVEDIYILPGLIDAHIHIESSMLTPAEFAKAAVCHGTIGTVSDPHEIANVLGIDGVKFMIDNGKTVPFKFYFGAPSCVPASDFETSGAVLDSDAIQGLLETDDIYYLAEMMNYPGVIYNDPIVREKIALADKLGKPVDGHAPGLTGEQLLLYSKAGITTDHECFTLEEAREKINAGMMIQIREGSAAKNFDALIPLMKEYPDSMMLCSDDKHPDDLMKGHINLLIKRALAKGYDLFDILRSCTLIPKKHYGLDNGLLQPGDPADLILIDNLKQFNIINTFINGQKVAENGQSLLEASSQDTPNIFNARKISEESINVKVSGKKLQLIQAIEDQLITHKKLIPMEEGTLFYNGDPDQDILKIVVLNRYHERQPTVAFIQGFGLHKGAIASTVAHDSHNIIAVGTNNRDIVNAVNLLIDSKGGIAICDEEYKDHLPLPVAGIMSNRDAKYVSSQYEKLDAKVKTLGTKLKAPFMTLSFMALLVIPALKISDQGLFDGNNFQMTTLFVND